MTITQCAGLRATGVADFARIGAELTDKYRQFDEDDQSNGEGQPIADKHDAGQNLEEMSTGLEPRSEASGVVTGSGCLREQWLRLKAKTALAVPLIAFVLFYALRLRFTVFLS